MKRNSKWALAMLSVLLVSSLVSSLTLAPCKAEDYTKVGVQVGDWAHYSFYTNATGLTEFTDANFTITGIDRCNVTFSFTMYNSTTTNTQTGRGNISSGVSDPTSIPLIWILVVPNLAKGDPICIGAPYKVNDTITMITGGKARVCNHCNITESGNSFDFYWDQATGIGLKANLIALLGTEVQHIEWSLISTSLWSPPDYTKVGVQVGDWAFYSFAETGFDVTSLNITVTEIDRCNVTLSRTVYYADGTIDTDIAWGNVSDGSYGPVLGIPFSWFLIAGGLGPNDLLYIDSPFWIDETVTMVIFGESRGCNHLYESGTVDSTLASMDLYWDSATGISIKFDYVMGPMRMQWNLTSTSLWSPAPTIDQPAAITYTYGTTGHSITWSPSSNVPRNYTIISDGTEVDSDDWNGEAVTCNVDGLAVGNYTYTCTVCDTIGRRASSIVTVRVTAPAPTIGQPAAITYTFGTTGHNITWQCSSLIPKNYTITRNGTQVSSGNWTGGAITCSVDGLDVGTYVFNCTVFDTLGRWVSSSVTVTVSSAQQPQPFPVELLIGGIAGIAAVVIVIAVVVLRKRGR